MKKIYDEMDIESRKVRNRLLISIVLLSLLFIATIIFILCDCLYFIPVSIILAIVLSSTFKNFIYSNEVENSIKTILFIISFIPFIALVVFCAKDAITGVNFFFPGTSVTYYGFDTFSLLLLFLCIFFSIPAPILPVCIIYQSHYIEYKKKIKNDERSDS